MTKEHINDNVAENTYIVKKDTNEKIMCMADGNIEEFEKISGINFEKLN